MNKRAPRPLVLLLHGWGADGNCFCQVVFNSSGYVQSNRYAVVLLTAGGSWDGAQTVIDRMAQVVLPVP